MSCASCLRVLAVGCFINHRPLLPRSNSLAADKTTTSTLVDGTAMLEEDGNTYKEDKKKRGSGREEDESDIGEEKFRRLQHLEALFGCSTNIKVGKA